MVAHAFAKSFPTKINLQLISVGNGTEPVLDYGLA